MYVCVCMCVNASKSSRSSKFADLSAPLLLRLSICYALSQVIVVVAFLYFNFSIVLRLTALTVIKVCCTYVYVSLYVRMYVFGL